MEWTEGPELILAGAGSGKTRVLTHRIAYLIREKKVSPWNILAITFTNKAAAEMRSRVDALVESGAEAIWVATFHSSCVRILRRFIDRIGYDNHFTIYDADDQKAAMREVLKQLQIDPKQLRERVVLSAISAAKNEMVDSVRYESEAKDFQTARIARCYRAYQDLLRKNNALDFDDLLFKTVQLFEADADVLAYYQERFRYIMVDEYQDTNSVQFRFIELLAKKYRNLCVVGDDDQSIYKFRGANIHNILNFEKAFPGAKVVKLEQNYRSSGNILEAANGVIQNNAGRKEKRLWTAAESGEKVRCRRYASAAEEAEEIAAEIKARAVGDDYGRFAVLYRTNAQSRVLEERFVAAGIPYRLVGGVNFYQRREIKDILAYLKTVANAADDLAVQRILNVPKRGIGAATVTAVSAFAAERDLRNVRVAPADASQLLATALPVGSVDEVWVFFPDPWRKPRHRKRRLVNTAFADSVARVLRPGGVWRLATDWADYAWQMRDVIEAVAALPTGLRPDTTRPYFRHDDAGARPDLGAESAEEDSLGNGLDPGSPAGVRGGWSPRYEGRVMTRFEQRGLDAGRTIRDLTAVRTEAAWIPERGASMLDHLEAEGQAWNHLESQPWRLREGRGDGLLHPADRP